MNTTNLKTYTKQIKVESRHIDELHHVNNIVYVQWVNEIAAEHWNAVTTPEIEEKYFWVLVNHSIQYKGQSFLGDIVEVRTRFSDTSTAKSDRIVAFYCQGKLIGRSVTTWCLMDKALKKMVRIAPEVMEIIGSTRT